MEKVPHSFTIIPKPITKETILKHHWETRSAKEQSNCVPKLPPSNFKSPFIRNYTNDWGSCCVCDL